MEARVGFLTWLGVAVLSLLLHAGHAQTSSGILSPRTAWPTATNDSDIANINGTENELPTNVQTTAAMMEPQPDTTTPNVLMNVTEVRPDMNDTTMMLQTSTSSDEDVDKASPTANATKVQKCPKVTCSMACPAGYHTDAEGCMLCKCLPRPHGSCKGTGCPENTICLEVDGTSVCKAMPLCMRHRAMLIQELRNINTFPLLVRGSPQVNDGLAGLRYIPTCEKDGSFAPKQCQKNSSASGGTEEMKDCWCVDDRGLEIPGSRHVVTDSNDTVCERKKTQQLEVFFKMMYSFEQLELQMDEFQERLRKQLSEWTTMEYEHIENLQVRPNAVDRVIIEFSIYQQGHQDLASVGFHFMHSVRYRNLQMHFKGTTFTPLPETLTVTHHYKGEEPRIAVCYFGPRLYQRKAIVHIVAAMVCGSVVLMLGVFFIILMARKKRASRDDDKEAFFGRNLFYTNMPSLIPTDEDKKEPIA